MPKIRICSGAGVSRPAITYSRLRQTWQRRASLRRIWRGLGELEGPRFRPRFSFGIALTALFLALAPQATEAISLDPISVPSSLKTGDRTLSIFSCGRREMLWADIYNVALYLPPNRNQKTALWNAQVPKAIRVEVVYDGEMPDRLPSDWQRELGKVLSDDSLQALQRTYGDLSNGDVVKVSYLPKRGAAVSVNNRSLDGIDPQPSHALVDALLELWLGDDPVSEQLRHDLASKGC